MTVRQATSGTSGTDVRGEDPNDRVLPRGAQTLAVKILAYAAGAIVAVLVARLLGPRQRGEWSLALLFASLLAQVADAGLSTSALYLIRNRPDRIRASVFMSGTIVCVSSAILGFLVLASRGLGLAQLVGTRFEVLVIAGLVVPVIALLGLLRQVLNALGDLPGANASILGQSLLLPVVLAAMLLTGPPVAEWALRGYLAVAGSTLLLTGYRLWRRVPPGLLWDSRLLGTLLRLGIPSQVGTFALSLTYRSDLFLVGHWLGLSAAGVYSVGLALSEMLRGVPETAQALVVSRAVKRDLPSYAGEVARMTVLVTAGAGLAAALIAPFAVAVVFGEPYHGAALVMACLVPGVIGLAVSYAISPLLFLEGRIVVSAIGALTSLAVLWGVSLCPPFKVSLPRVAIASSLAYWTLAGIQLGYLITHRRIEGRSVVPGIGEFATFIKLFGGHQRR